MTYRKHAVFSGRAVRRTAGPGSVGMWGMENIARRRCAGVKTACSIWLSLSFGYDSAALPNRVSGSSSVETASHGFSTTPEGLHKKKRRKANIL